MDTLKRVINKYRNIGDDLRFRIYHEDDRVLKLQLELELNYNDMLLIDLGQIETDMLLNS